MNPLWSVVGALGALAAAIVGGVVVHVLARSRDRENDRRRQRVDYLVNAYRTLVRSAHRDMRGERGQAFEDALSDIVLLGTSDQIAAARSVVTGLEAKREASIDELLVSLRNALRTELGIGADQEHVPLLRLSWGAETAMPSPVTTQDGVLVQFDAVLADTRRLLEATAESERPNLGSLDAGDEFVQLRELAQQAPGSAVVAAYGKLGDRLAELLAADGADQPESRDALHLARAALGRGLITEQSVHTIEGLSILMNLSRSGGSGTGLSVEKANEYLDLVAATLYSLNNRG